LLSLTYDAMSGMWDGQSQWSRAIITSQFLRAGEVDMVGTTQKLRVKNSYSFLTAFPAINYALSSAVYWVGDHGHSPQRSGSTKPGNRLQVK